MLQVHMRHSATELADGRILIVGGTLSKGSYTGIGEAEIFDPSTREWSYAGNLKEGRQGHSATLLTTGQALIAGGWNPITDPIPTAELYTPAGKTFTYTLGRMSLGRRYQAAVPLLDGSVLVAGGFNGTATAESFHPGPQTFQLADGVMIEERDRPTATYLLNTETAMDGKILFAGGVYPGTGSHNGKLLEVFDSGTGTFTASGSMTTARRGVTATLIGTSY
jgi:Galactose oxidase, central domain